MPDSIEVDHLKCGFLIQWQDHIDHCDARVVGVREDWAAEQLRYVLHQAIVVVFLPIYVRGVLKTLREHRIEDRSRY